MMKTPSSKEYAALLVPWVKNAQQHLYTCPDRPELCCYGTGYNTWGVQTNQKALSAFIAACLEPEAAFTPELPRERVQAQALSMLRYSLQTHIEGDYTCTDGQKWGHTWISVLGVERMMAAVDAFLPCMSGEDRALLRRVLISEADWLLEEYPIVAGLTAAEGRNKPESNIWNGALLARTAAMYPDAPNAARYREKAVRFFLNGISTEADEKNTQAYDGVRVCDAFEGANFFDDLGCDHHSYMNLGYMVICLSNIAMLHFFYRRRGEKAPEALYHRAQELWRLVRSLTYEDGRLLRIGGDSRARYCYCQDYALPVWLLAEDAFGEDCAMLENGWLNILRQETAYNADGSFLSARCHYMRELTPLYYTRLESDRANVLALAALWRRELQVSGSRPAQGLIDNWHTAYHGGCFVRGKNRLAAFVWRSAEPAQGLCLPADDSSLAEWRHNLTGSVRGLGGLQRELVLGHSESTFPGGFLTYGQTECLSKNFIAEGQLEDHQAVKTIAYAALPDDATILCIQSAAAKNRTAIKTVKGLQLNIPNDIFNRCVRTYFYEGGECLLHGAERGQQGLIPAGRWVCAGQKLGAAVPAGEGLQIYRPGRRQIPLINQGRDTRDDNGTLYCDEILSAYQEGNCWYDRGEPIYTTAFACAVGNAGQMESLAGSLSVPELPEGITGISALGRDGQRYLLVCNLSHEERAVASAGWQELAAGKAAQQESRLAPGQAALFRL